MTAIVGASGSGKTTMLKMILGFYKPVSGEVLLGGHKISDYSPTAWRKNVELLCKKVLSFQIQF